MPHVTGYEFCRAVKHDPTLCSVPVILLSTLSEAEDIIRGLDAGADNYVTKPYDTGYLLARIEALRSTPVATGEHDGPELSVSLAGQTYRVKSGRQQVLNLLISTFENAVEKNRELHRMNEQLTLAKEKLTQWNAQLESLNGQLATANERMSRDLQAAARVQRSLLPDGNLEIPRVDVAWQYTPCEELAGDFLNLVLLDDEHLAMFVVDVSGHGAASSLLAVAVGRLLTGQASATSLLVRHDPLTGQYAATPPSAVVAELNRRFPMESQAGLYFTIAYGVLNTHTREFRYVSAGHPPGVHLPRGGKPAFLAGDGFAVGWLDETDYEEHRLILEPGDRLFLYSDGVNEARSVRRRNSSEEIACWRKSKATPRPSSLKVSTPCSSPPAPGLCRTGHTMMCRFWVLRFRLEADSSRQWERDGVRVFERVGVSSTERRRPSPPTSPPIHQPARQISAPQPAFKPPPALSPPPPNQISTLNASQSRHRPPSAGRPRRSSTTPAWDRSGVCIPSLPRRAVQVRIPCMEQKKDSPRRTWRNSGGASGK